MVDVDHFLAAETFSLHAATHLTQRPKGHNLMVCGLLPLVAKLKENTCFFWKPMKQGDFDESKGEFSISALYFVDYLCLFC